MQRFDRQFPDNFKTFSGAADHIKREGVGDCAVHVLRRAIIRFFGEDLRLLCILVDVQTEPREVGGDGGFVRRTFVKALENVVEFFEIVLCAVKLVESIEGFASGGWISGEARPKLLGFDR